MADAPDGGPLPLLQAVPPEESRVTADTAAHPGRAETVAWAYRRDDGGRSFGLSGVHYDANWAEPSLPRAHAGQAHAGQARAGRARRAGTRRS
jgi:hypothetical protein